MGRSPRPGWGEREGESGPVLHCPRIPRRGRSLLPVSMAGAHALCVGPARSCPGLVSRAGTPGNPGMAPPTGTGWRRRVGGGAWGAARGLGRGGSTRRRREKMRARVRGWPGAAWEGGGGRERGGGRRREPGAARPQGQPWSPAVPRCHLSAPQLLPRVGDSLVPRAVTAAPSSRGQRHLPRERAGRESGFCERLVMTERVNSARKIIRLLIAASALVPWEPGCPSVRFVCWASPLSAFIEL